MLLFTLSSVFGQKKYTQEVKAQELILDGKALKGYTSNFGFEREEVRKGWWKYAKEFGNPLNMKSYYIVKIPAETTDGNVDMEVVTQTTSGKGGCNFFLGLSNETYKPQALAILLDFKKKFYISQLTAQLTENLGKGNELGKKYRDTIVESERWKLLNDLVGLQKRNSSLIQEIVTTEQVQ